ncbi:M48 family metallopeptidase [Nocardia sp. JW2]|uniref:M48 family metallopeptidase n=1 Tax=Nocardia sp. JW2 TaxID=3450738 RepID=UPI003F42D066
MHPHEPHSPHSAGPPPERSGQPADRPSDATPADQPAPRPGEYPPPPWPQGQPGFAGSSPWQQPSPPTGAFPAPPSGAYPPVPQGFYPPGGPPGTTQPMPRGLSPFGMPARHPWEIPLLVVVIMITGVAYLLAILMLLVELVAEPVVDAQGQPESGGSLLTSPYVLVLLFAPVLLWAGRGMNFARMRINGVKMSPTQFPEGYRLVQEAAARFGMSKAPDAYVILGNGQINAFASGHGFRRFVVVYSDLFEIGGAAREPDALAFIIGHEVGHIAAGHVSYWRQLGMFVAPYLPILGSSLIRAQEYTADNHGFCNRHQGAAGAMATLAAGKYLNTEVGFDEMADRAATEKGGFVLLVNAMSSHPVLTWRMWALRDRSKPGPMFWHPSPPHPGTLPPPGGYPLQTAPPALPPKPL